MQHILIWVEPYPIRNSFCHFSRSVGQTLSDLATALQSSGRYLTSVFSNFYALEQMRLAGHFQHSHYIEPTFEEDQYFRSLMQVWDSSAVEAWRDYIVNGQASKSPFDLALERIHSNSPIDAVVTWSESRTLARFSSQTQVPVLYTELGPTREPFQPTMYADFKGLNGNASVRGFDIPNSPKEALSHRAWARSGETSQLGLNSPNELMDGYGVIPLQIADDTNLLLHSPFENLEEYVEVCVDRLKRRGLVPVIKSHPGARRTSFSEVRQARALKFAERLGALRWSEEWGTDITTLLRNSEEVVTINSSVGFENVMLGGITFVFGRALYSELVEAEMDPKVPVKLVGDSRASWLLRHYFIPSSEFAARVPDLLEVGGLHKPKLQHAVVRRAWHNFDFSPVREQLEVPIVGPGASGGSTLDSSSGKGKLLPRRRRLRGRVERMEVTRKRGNRVVLRLAGWAQEKKSGSGPSLVTCRGSEGSYIQTSSFRFREGVVDRSGKPTLVFFELSGELGLESLRDLRLEILFDGEWPVSLPLDLVY